MVVKGLQYNGARAPIYCSDPTEQNKGSIQQQQRKTHSKASHGMRRRRIGNYAQGFLEVSFQRRKHEKWLQALRNQDWHRLNPKEGEGEPGEETKESEGDMAGERQRKVETTVAGGQDELFLGPVTKEKHQAIDQWYQ